MTTKVRYCVGNVGHPGAAEHSQSSDVAFTAVVGDRCCERGSALFESTHWITVKQL